eukprot:2268615-Prymnesium_polylepis.1
MTAAKETLGEANIETETASCITYNITTMEIGEPGGLLWGDAVRGGKTHRGHSAGAQDRAGAIRPRAGDADPAVQALGDGDGARCESSIHQHDVHPRGRARRDPLPEGRQPARYLLLARGGAALPAADPAGGAQASQPESAAVVGLAPAARGAAACAGGAGGGAGGPQRTS